MNSAKSSRFNDNSRCTHQSASGARCRSLASSGSRCPAHAERVIVRQESADLTAHLTADLSNFNSAEPINQFLSRLLLLLAQDRISPRRGAVMAYTANLLLRSVTVMQHEAADRDKNRPVNIIWDIPRPRSEMEQAPCKQPA